MRSDQVGAQTEETKYTKPVVDGDDYHLPTECEIISLSRIRIVNQYVKGPTCQEGAVVHALDRCLTL